MGGAPAESHGDLAPQYILTVLVNLVSFTYGMMVGWLAPMQPLIQAEKTPDNSTIRDSPFGQGVEFMSPEQISWIGGFFCIGGVLGGPLYGYFANIFGRKKSLYLCVTPFMLSFGLFMMATNPYYIFVGRFIAGIAGGGTCVIVPMYVGESVEPVCRGILGSCFNLFICLGILASFIIGSYTSYMFFAGFAMIFPVIFLVASMWLPETPIYSLLKNRSAEAGDALWKLRGNHRDVVEREMAVMTSQVKEMTSSDVETMSLGEMMSDPATRKGLIIGTVLMAVMQFSGIAPILNYTVVIFQASGSNMSPHLSAIIVGTLQISAAFIATVFMDRAGRKFFLLVSAIGMTFTLTPIAVFFYYKDSEANEEFMASIGWVPVTSLAVYIITYAMGFGAVPFLLVAEMFKTAARSKATSICVIAVWAFSFFLLKFFTNLQTWLGTSTCFGIFALCCFFGAAFTWFYIPETKGKTLETIIWELGGRDEMHHLERSSPIPLVVDEEKMEVIKTYSNGTQDVKLTR